LLPLLFVEIERGKADTAGKNAFLWYTEVDSLFWGLLYRAGMGFEKYAQTRKSSTPTARGR